MWRKHDTEVLVVGAGPVGLMSALTLAERGLHVRIIDQENCIGERNYALTLHPSSLELLDDLGLTSDLLARGIVVDRVGFYDFAGRRRAEIRMGAIPAKFRYLLVLPQTTLEQLLEQRLLDKGVRIDWCHRLSALEDIGDGVSVTIEKLGVESGGYPIAGRLFVIDKVSHDRAQFVIGADGFNSIVRRRVPIDVDSAGDPASFAVVELDADAGVDGEARIVFDDESANVLWPLPEGQCRWSLQLEAQDVTPDDRLVLEGKRAHHGIARGRTDALLRERARWFRGMGAEVTKSLRVCFEPALAQSFGRGRVWLAGDATHVTSPVGVHSMNAGLMEAHELASRVERILRSGATIETIERYSWEQMAEWRQLLGLEAGPVPMPTADPWVAQHASGLLPCIPASGGDLRDAARQIGLDLPPAAPR